MLYGKEKRLLILKSSLKMYHILTVYIPFLQKIYYRKVENILANVKANLNKDLQNGGTAENGSATVNGSPDVNGFPAVNGCRSPTLLNGYKTESSINGSKNSNVSFKALTKESFCEVLGILYISGYSIFGQEFKFSCKHL